MRQELQAFDAFSDGSFFGIRLHAFVRKQLHLYHLNGVFSENDILHEMYIRWVKTIAKGTEINNLQAWTYGCCLNIVRELLRKNQQTYNIEDYDSIADLHSPSLDDEEFKRELNELQRHLQTLMPIDQIILNLNVIQCYSWEKVRAALEEGGYGSFETVSLRKRKERALKRLRERLTEES
jgi:DNA-directed RNA polymerase specialized sigma24 family protein